MVTAKDKNVILLPIFPKYAEAIFEGRKLVEFRKLNIPQTATHVVVYSTAPRKEVIGIFKVKKITKDRPRSLWKKFKEDGCIEKKLLMEYYAGHDFGIALHVGEKIRFKESVSLDALEEALTPPQSFRYLKKNHLNRIVEYLV